MKININQKLYNGKGNPIRSDGETVLTVIKKFASKDIKQYDSTESYVNAVLKDMKSKDLTVREVLENSAAAVLDDKEKKAIDDFDLYLKFYNISTTNIELNEDDINRLKHKVRKVYDNNLIIGQVTKILEGHVNPMKPKTNQT